MYILALHCTPSLFPLLRTLSSLFPNGFGLSYVYISTSQKSDSPHADSRLLLWICLLAVTLFLKASRTHHCLPCLRQNRSMVLFCSGTLLQGHWFPKAGSLCWHADSFKLCLTEQPRAINHLTSMWNDAVSQTEEREKDLSHVCSSYPIRQPWNCYHAHDSVFSLVIKICSIQRSYSFH